MDIQRAIETLRREGADTARCEAKRAADGFPENVAETLSAFANTPGGGDIIFGLDESNRFTPVPVYDVAACQRAVASLARDGLEPPIHITTEVTPHDGVNLVVAHVPEADRALKPVRVRRSGKAYLRQHDGDYPLSDLEIQALIAARGNTRFDNHPVEGAALTDLDADQLAAYITERRRASPVLTGMTDHEVLVRTGVITHAAIPTIAGLLALGIYPQQFFPNLGIQASLVRDSRDPEVRTLDAASFAGSIPTMLQAAETWVSRVTPLAIVANQTTGNLDNQPVFPAVAVRELIANALIHRDLGPYARTAPVTLRIELMRDGALQMVVSNLGGLLGLSVESLGKTPSYLRNAWLAEILQSVRTGDGHRVVERLGSGIPAVRDALEAAGLAAPVFHDLGVRFTARITARPVGLPAGPDAVPPTWGNETVTLQEALILTRLADGPATAKTLVAVTGLTPAQVRYALRTLRDSATVRTRRFDGRTDQYELSAATTTNLL